MQKTSKTVLVTGIGGNVGQGILRNIRTTYPDLLLVGTDIGRATAGHHFCDTFHQTPYCFDSSFEHRFLQICDSESIDLIIPATDYEAYHLGLLTKNLPPLVASPAEVTKICLDKFKTHEMFKARGVPFAPSCLPSEFQGQWEHTLVKPREGRGSRGIHINPNDASAFDDSFLVQQMLTGTEITSAFYITQKKDILGPITFERELANGMTERCETTTDYDKELQDYIEIMAEAFPFRGPVNLQAIVNPDSPIIPFEINCRYSGTNSVRSKLGFEDVKYGIQEYLLKEEPDTPQIRHGCAVRVFLDIIYPGQCLVDLEPGDRKSFLH